MHIRGSANLEFQNLVYGPNDFYDHLAPAIHTKGMNISPGRAWMDLPREGFSIARVVTHRTPMLVQQKFPQRFQDTRANLTFRGICSVSF